MKRPVALSIQYAPSAEWPAGRMAARSFIDTPTTLALKSVAIFSSSPMVVVSMLRGDIMPASLSVPTPFTVGSEQQYAILPSIMKSLPAMPCIAGTLPVNIDVWPTAVTVGT